MEIFLVMVLTTSETKIDTAFASEKSAIQYISKQERPELYYLIQKKLEDRNICITWSRN